MVAQAARERVPLRHRQHHAEVPHRHGVAVDLAGAAMAGLVGREVRDDLVAVEVEVDPRVGRTSLRAAEQAAVEPARGFEGVDGKGEVKRVHGDNAESMAARGAIVADGVPAAGAADRLRRRRGAGRRARQPAQVIASRCLRRGGG